MKIPLLNKSDTAVLILLAYTLGVILLGWMYLDSDFGRRAIEQAAWEELNR